MLPRANNTRPATSTGRRPIRSESLPAGNCVTTLAAKYEAITSPISPGDDPCWRRYEGSSGRIELPPIQSRNVVAQSATTSVRSDALDGRPSDRRFTTSGTVLALHDPTGYGHEIAARAGAGGEAPGVTDDRTPRQSSRRPAAQHSTSLPSLAAPPADPRPGESALRAPPAAAWLVHDGSISVLLLNWLQSRQRSPGQFGSTSYQRGHSCIEESSGSAFRSSRSR